MARSQRSPQSDGRAVTSQPNSLGQVTNSKRSLAPRRTRTHTNCARLCDCLAPEPNGEANQNYLLSTLLHSPEPTRRRHLLLAGLGAKCQACARAPKASRPPTRKALSAAESTSQPASQSVGRSVCLSVCQPAEHAQLGLARLCLLPACWLPSREMISLPVKWRLLFCFSPLFSFLFSKLLRRLRLVDVRARQARTLAAALAARAFFLSRSLAAPLALA